MKLMYGHNNLKKVSFEMLTENIVIERIHGESALSANLSPVHKPLI